jgi:hypothetical protein
VIKVPKIILQTVLCKKIQDGWMGRCLTHDDENPSVSIRQTEDVKKWGLITLDKRVLFPYYDIDGNTVVKRVRYLDSLFPWVPRVTWCNTV